MQEESFHTADKLITIVVGLVTGFTGYWFTTFWMKPILRYRELRSSILSDFIFYAQVIDPSPDLDDRLKNLYGRRVESNRKNSAELKACLLELPKWYLWYLHWRGYKPKGVPSELMGYSNEVKDERARQREDKMRKWHGLPPSEEESR